jgi:GTPase SAR1 family protein
MQLFVDRCGNDTPKILLGNKSDLFSPETLPAVLEKHKSKIDRLVVVYKCLFFTVSARTGEGIDEAFAALIEEIYKAYFMSEKKPRKDVIKLHSFEIEERGRLSRRPKDRC